MDAGQRQAKAGHGNHEQLINSSINPRNNHTNQVLNCPRCNSLNTKFCYYNNYSLLQPRHFCKNCRRYWTSGGVLRNVPVGGGCRKNKRSSSSTSSSSTPSKQRLGADNSASCSISTVITAPTAQLSTVHRRQNDLSSVSNVLQLQPSAALPESTTTSTTLPTSLYYALHRNNNISPIEYGDEPSFPFTSRPLTQPSTLRLTDRICQISTNPSLNPLANPSLSPLAAHSSLLNLQSRSSTAANHHLASLPPFTLASLMRSHLSNFGSFSLRNELMGLDFNAANYPKQPSLHPNLLDPTAISEDLKHNPHLNSNPHLPSATTVVTSTTPSTGTAVSNDILLNSFSLALDSFNSNNRDDGQWKSHHQKQIKLPNQSNITNDQQEGQLRGQLQVLLPFENQAMGGLMQQHSQQSAKPGLMPDNFKVKGELEPPVENWPGQEAFLEPSAADANYWNNTNSAWPDLSAYGPSTATHLL